MAGDTFCGVMKTFIHETRYRFFSCQKFIELLDEIPHLAADVLTNMIRSREFMHTTYPKVCSSCGMSGGTVDWRLGWQVVGL
ncbi:hypothetical protein PG994_006787 [Apiospora phragmitis]|uniref:Uncharacterized protein n=1 Tax=Apiospora phragmitis TaxID=2905665 RepID=A0ABR1VG14_9PEZI